MRYNSITIGAVEMRSDSLDTHLGLYNLIKVKGLDSAVRRVSQFQKPGAHGAVISASLYGERVVALSVQIIGTSEADYLAKHKALAQECDITDGTFKTVTIEDSNGDLYQIVGQVEVFQDDDGDEKRSIGTLVISITCEEFEISSASLNTRLIYLETGTDGLGIPTEIPLGFGTGTDGEAIITNNGDVPSKPVIRFNGPLINPTIFNQTTGKTMQYSDTINAGEWIEIDMQNTTVVNQSGSNKLGSLSTTLRKFWELIPGANTIQFFHEGAYNTDANCTVSWRDKYTSI